MAAPTLRPLLLALRQAQDWRDAKQQAEKLVGQIWASRPNEQAKRNALVWALMGAAGKPPAGGDESA